MYLDTLLIEENLKNIIDGKSTVKEVAKTLGYTQDDVESLVEESMSPLEKLLSRAFPSVKGVLIDRKQTNQRGV